MASYKKYVDEIKKKFGYNATWTPDTPLKLGDVGIIENGAFTRTDTLTGLGLEEVKVRQDETAASLSYQSEKSVNISVNAGADVSPGNSAVTNAKGSFTITFGKEGGVLLEANEVYSHSIENLADVRKLMLEKFKSGDWKKSWLVITEIKQAGSATVLYSTSSNASIELNASTNISASATIADVNAGLSAGKSKNMDIKIVGDAGITPLFKGLGIKKKLFKGPEVTSRGDLFAEPEPTPEITLDDIEEI